MKIPVYIVTGYLDAGKTTFLNTVLSNKKNREKRILLIQFESGDQQVRVPNGHLKQLNFEIQELSDYLVRIRKKIEGVITSQLFDEIWIEWNGMASFQIIEDLFWKGTGLSLCYIEKVIFLGEIQTLNERMDKTGAVPFSQLANSDLIILREERKRKKPLIKGKSYGNKEWQKGKNMIDAVNKKALIFKENELRKIMEEIYQKKSMTKLVSYMTVFFVILILMVTKDVWKDDRLIQVFAINFIGIFLQALPFLILGVLLSSFIQVYVTKEWLNRIFPKQTAAGMICAVLFGFFLPVCDCTSIPVFKSLIKKGIPVSAAVTFMTVSPVINPVVILSTYYAFGGNVKIVLTRMGFGIIASVLIGLSFQIKPPKMLLKNTGYTDIWCGCGCYELKEEIKPAFKKLYLFIKHAQAEFFTVFRYLAVGIFISVLIQMLHTEFGIHFEHGAFPVQLFIMMLLGFLFSLCSSSDAIVARSYESSFSMGALYGFLILGPMMDIKNMLMISSGFTKRFVIRLMVTCFIICYLVVYLMCSLKIGGGLS